MSSYNERMRKLENNKLLAHFRATELKVIAKTERNTNKTYSGTVKEYTFQILDVTAKDQLTGKDQYDMCYTVNIFGRKEDGQTVYARIRDFEPHFYFRVPRKDFRSAADIRSPSFPIKFKKSLKDAMGFPHKHKVTDVEVVRKTDIYGFKNGEKEFFVKVSFKTHRAFKRAFECVSPSKWSKHRDPMKILGSYMWKPYESNIDPILRFLHYRNIKPCGWVTIKNSKPILSFEGEELKESISLQNEEFSCKYRDIQPVQRDIIAPFVIASFDIECIGDDSYSFPEADKRSNKIIQIGCTITKTGIGAGQPPIKWLAALDTTAPVEGAKIVSYKTERKLLIGFAKFIRKQNPDIITGYNIFGFDFNYIWERIELLDIKGEFGTLSRFRGKTPVLNKKSLNSSAIGNALYVYMDVEGRVALDLYEYIKNNYKYRSYKLDNVAKILFGVEKMDGKLRAARANLAELKEEIAIIKENKEKLSKADVKAAITVKIAEKKVVKKEIAALEERIAEFKKEDMPYEEIFGHQNGTPEMRARIASYCIQDCLLCNKIIDKIDLITNNIGMCNVVFVPMAQMLLKGQGVKALSLVSKFAYESDGILPLANKNRGSQDKYKGAIVLEANVGGYFDPVSVNDFASLYPSSMVSHNLSMDTWVEKGGKYDNLPGIEYQNIEWTDEHGYQCHRFTIPRPIPAAAMALIDEEKDVKKRDAMMEEAEANREGRGIISRIEIYLLSSRKRIKKLMKKETDPFKKALLDGLQLAYKLTANSLYGQLGNPTGDVQCVPIAACITTVGRQLLTLARDTALKIFPGAFCVYGDSVTGDTALLLKNPKGLLCIKTIDEFYDDMYVKNYNSNNGVMVDEEKNPIDKMYAEVEKGWYSWSDNGWTPIKRVMRHLTDKNIIRVTTHTGSVDVTEDHSLLLDDKTPITPKNVDIGSRLCQMTYECDDVVGGVNNNDVDIDTISSLFVKDNSNFVTIRQIVTTINNHKIMRFCVDKKFALFVTVIAGMMGKHYKLCEDNGYLFTFSDKQLYNDTPRNTVTSKHTLFKTSRFVYDLTTENHHFQAGVGDIIVHNTDSIMIKYPTKTKKDPTKKLQTKAIREARLQESIDCAVEVEKVVSAKLPWPHCLEYEKTYQPYFLYSKKRYTGVLYEFDVSNFKYIDNKGNVLTRRDNAYIVQDVFKGAVDILLFKQDVDAAIIFIKNILKDVLAGKYPIEKFIITKRLKCSSGYKNPETIAHRVLADKMTLRNPGAAPQPNTRMPFAYIHVNDKDKRAIMREPRYTSKKTKATKLMQGDMIEDPDYIIKNKMKLDYVFYITNQIEKPITQLMELFDNEFNKNVMKPIIKQAEARSKGFMDINSFFK